MEVNSTAVEHRMQNLPHRTSLRGLFGHLIYGNLTITSGFKKAYIDFKPFPNDKNLDSSKLKEFADDNIKCDKNDRNFS